MKPFPNSFRGWLRWRNARVIGGVIAFSAMAGAAQATTSLLVNHDFSTNLSGWTTEGDVQPSSGFAVLIDDTVAISSLHQSVASGPGIFELSFDFFDGLSSTVPMGTLLDVAFATLYLGDGAFVSPGNPGSFDEVIPLFDLDANGIFNLVAGASIGATPGRPGWMRFDYSFATTRSNVTPFLELIDQNTVDADSSLAVDTVHLNQVPEPGRAVLLLLGFVFVFMRRAREKVD